MVETKLSDADKQFIRAYVAESHDEEEKRARRRECAAQYGVSLATISAITAWTKIWGDKKVDEPVVIEVEADDEVVDIEDVLECVDDDEDANEAYGCHANYDNATKQLWREKWKEFVAKHTTPSERQRMKVLCLPGKKCLEVPIYLDLGFKACNIVGVEGGDEDAKREFHDNAYRYGIIPKLGRLENILPKMKDVFDIVSLDFTGPISKKCLDIIKMLPIAPAADVTTDTKSLFMVNLLAKRETQSSQTVLDFYASFTRPELQDLLAGPKVGMEDFRKVYRYMSDIEEKVSNGEKVYEEADLQDKRNIGLVFVITSLLAANRRGMESRWRAYRSDDAKDLTPEEFNIAAANTLAILLDCLSRYVKPKIIDFLTLGVPNLMEMVGSYRPFVYELEQYQYSSPVNNRNSPFMTEMYQLMTPMGDYGRARYFIRFFIDAIYWQAKNAGRQMFLEVRDKVGHRMTPFQAGGLDNKDNICFVDQDGIMISSICWQRILDTYKALFQHINKDKVTNILTHGQNSRISLT